MLLKTLPKNCKIIPINDHKKQKNTGGGEYGTNRMLLKTLQKNRKSIQLIFGG
jgi:hypothetical protein